MPGVFSFSATDLLAIKDGFNSITIGQNAGTGIVTVSAPVTFRDAVSITACAIEAFRHYIPRLGLTPIPMTKDYGAAIANAKIVIVPGR